MPSLHPVGVLVGILVSLPDAFGLKAYGGIIGAEQCPRLHHAEGQARWASA
jgi:hypothetical protein